ncbi:MAG: TlpA disulfide reductase family protein [Thermodesulfovibrionales bacterium]
MKPNKPLLAVAGVAIAAALYGAYFYMNRTPFEQLKPAVGDTAPEISLADLSGRMVRLADLRGKVVLVNFWAGWCPPCKTELAEFQKVADRYESRGFAVVAVSINEVTPDIVRSLKISFPVINGSARVIKAYGDITNVPVSFLVGRDGKVVRKTNEVYPEQELVRDLEAALAAPAQ